jgi:exopolysaccharide biosynthesis protein
VPFDSPWDESRACLLIDGDGPVMGPRSGIGPEPAGDLLQAGPLLVCDGRCLVRTGSDPEGFSAGSIQFDSDITVGRYPRAALGLNGGELIAAVCDGRGEHDDGLTLVEMAEAMIELGAVTAINLDGGGSASLVVGGRLRNSPREEHGIDLVGGRPISTALVFERRPEPRARG